MFNNILKIVSYCYFISNIMMFVFQNGFDTLHVLVPALSCNPNSKISKAATLQKSE